MKAHAFSAIALFSLFACTANDLKPATQRGSLNAESIAKVRQEIVFNTSGEALSVEVLSIEDARCPSDVTCIWAGYVKVSFYVSATSETVALAIPPNQPPGPSLGDNHSFNFSGKTYRLDLKDVIPYPTRKNQGETKSAVFELSLL